MTDRRLDYTRLSYAELRDDMLARAEHLLPEWTDRSPGDFGVMLIEAFAHLGDTLMHAIDRLATESYLETAIDPESIERLLFLIGGSVQPPQQSVITVDDPGEIDENTIFTTGNRPGGPVRFRLRLPLDEARVRGRLDLHHVDEHIAGEPLQLDGANRHALRSSPVVLESIRVTQGEDIEWARVDTLTGSGPGDRHYRVRYGRGGRAWLELGDGRQGAPPVGEIAVAYDVGGGSRGNVHVTTLRQLGSDAGPLRTHGPAVGGGDGETLQQAVDRCTARFAARDRCLTARDYESLIRSAGLSLRTVRAVQTGWARVTVYVLPEGGTLTPGARDQLLEYLDARRPLGVEVDVAPFDLLKLWINLEVYPAAGVSAETLTPAIESALAAQFSPEAAEPGQRLFSSKIYEAVERLAGVDGVKLTHFADFDPDQRGAEDQDGVPAYIVLGPNQVPSLERVNVTER